MGYHAPYFVWNSWTNKQGIFCPRSNRWTGAFTRHLGLHSLVPDASKIQNEAATMESWGILGSLCKPTGREISGNTRGKWDRIFRLNRANRNGSATFFPLPNSLIRLKHRFVNNGTANFGRNIPTEISGPPPEMIPNIPVGRNRNGLFYLNSHRNFRKLLHNGKHLWFCRNQDCW